MNVLAGLAAECGEVQTRALLEQLATWWDNGRSSGIVFTLAWLCSEQYGSPRGKLTPYDTAVPPVNTVLSVSVGFDLPNLEKMNCH